MGDMADELYDRVFDEEESCMSPAVLLQNQLEGLLRRYQQGELYWTTIKGERILVGNLEGSHLANIINFLERKLSRKTTVERQLLLTFWVSILLTEQEKRK